MITTVQPMYCRKCGKQNADDAVFCQKCGTILEPEEETRVAGRPAAAVERPAASDAGTEAEIFSISPTLLFVKIGYAAAALAAVVLVGAISIAVPSVSTWIAVLAGFILLLIPAYFHFRQKLIKYTLTDSKIEIDSGLVSRVTRNVPLGRIQDVTVSTNISQRLLGFGDIVIDNASEQGGKLVMKNINSPRRYADMLLKEVHRLGR